MIAVDTNILIYAHRAGAPLHRSAQRAIERAAQDPAGWGFALATIGEFWCQVTHPAYPGGPSTARLAADFLQSLATQGAARIFLPGRGFADRLMAAARKLDVHGARIFDLQIGLAALEAGARQIWTHDRGFTPLDGLERVDPLA